MFRSLIHFNFCAWYKVGSTSFFCTWPIFPTRFVDKTPFSIKYSEHSCQKSLDHIRFISGLKNKTTTHYFQKVFLRPVAEPCWPLQPCLHWLPLLAPHWRSWAGERNLFPWVCRFLLAEALSPTTTADGCKGLRPEYSFWNELHNWEDTSWCWCFYWKTERSWWRSRISDWTNHCSQQVRRRDEQYQEEIQELNKVARHRPQPT